jgi:hypothetical protein
MPGATRVAGFKTWLKLGYCVRKGERAVIRIWVPISPNRKQLAEWEAAGTDPAARPRTYFSSRPGVRPLAGHRASPAGQADAA